eukprot:scaffold1946_cov188-Ochromonas_danica.AAC.3
MTTSWRNFPNLRKSNIREHSQSPKLRNFESVSVVVVRPAALQRLEGKNHNQIPLTTLDIIPDTMMKSK